jgi:hypothetical protein
MDNLKVVVAQLRRSSYGFTLGFALLLLFVGTVCGQTTDEGNASQGQSSQQSPQSQPATGDDTVNAQEKIVSPKEAKELCRSVDEILKFASQDAELPIEHSVKRKLANRNQVQSYLEKNMKDDKDAKRMERSSAVLKKFGLLPRDFDFGNFLVAMLKEQIAGYYDFKTKTVNLLNWLDADQQKPVLAHELTHALQDQSFDIDKWMKASGENADEKKESKKDRKKDEPSPADIENDEDSSARQAVIEGQAMVVLLDYMMAPQGKTALNSPQIVEALEQGMLTGTPDSPKFRDAPLFLKEELTFPYRYGLDFTLALEKAGGKELAYAGAFKDPPKTTREIMEPQTYLAHEKLQPMKMIDMEKDFKGYDPFDIGAMGEFDVNLLVEQYAGRKQATAIYPGWRGGYYFAGKPKAEKLAPIAVLYVSRWSSPAKAAEFAAVYAKSLAQRYQKHQGLAANGKVEDNAPPTDSWRSLRGRHAWLTEEGIVLIEVRDDEILISESLDDETTKRVEADFWPEEKVAPAKP